MRTQHFEQLIIEAALSFCASSAWAQPACDTTFDPKDPETGLPVDEGDWGVAGNWTFGVPDATKVACIPPGKSAMICLASAAKAIVIESQGEVRSPDYGGTLTLGNPADLVDSRIDGRLRFDGDFDKSLEIASHVTIVGNGGDILGNCMLTGSNNKPSTIKSTGGAWTLTLQGVDNSTRGTSLVLHGRFNIEVPLVNNAYVVADHAEPPDGDGLIALNAGPNSGNGYWIAEDSANGVGTLQINASVSGSGTWIVQNDFRAEIRINAPCTALTGDVIVQKGKLTLNADFTSTGNLEFRSIGGSAPTITLVQGVIAYFD